MQIVSERRIADEQKKQVEADSERIGLEAAECKAISDDAEADLAMYIITTILLYLSKSYES